MRYSVCEDNDAPRSRYVIWVSKRFVFREIFAMRLSVTFLQVWPLAVGENLSYAHSNGKFSVAMAMYPYVLVKECSLEQLFKLLYNILYV